MVVILHCGMDVFGCNITVVEKLELVIFMIM